MFGFVRASTHQLLADRLQDAREHIRDLEQRCESMMFTITQMQDANKRHDDTFERLMLAYADLTRKLSPEPPSLPERTRDEVIDAIIAKAGSNGQLRAHLASWAMSQRRQKVDDDEIVKGILVWTDSEQDQAE